jgi:hypothetical protein
LTVSLFKAEGMYLGWVGPLRLTLLLLANLWSLRLGWRILGGWSVRRSLPAAAFLVLALGWVDASWWLMLCHW